VTMTTDRRSSPLAALVAAAILLSPVAYVLSVGPVVWLHDHGLISEAVAVIYAPLQYLHDHSKQAAGALDWYIDLWR
jgi:hypothetical protein